MRARLTTLIIQLKDSKDFKKKEREDFKKK